MRAGISGGSAVPTEERLKGAASEGALVSTNDSGAIHRGQRTAIGRSVNGAMRPWPHPYENSICS